MKWWYYIILAGVGAVGFLAGRGSVRQGSVSDIAVSPTSTSRDGGVPETVAKTSVGGSNATTTITCEVKPPSPPRTVYVSRLVPGTGYVSCPEPTACPVLTCSGTSSSTQAESHSEASAPLLPPQVVTVTKEIRSTWGIGAGAAWSDASGVKPSFGIVYQPWRAVEFQVGGSTQPSFDARIYLRF
jgi:hypothetical protein